VLASGLGSRQVFKPHFSPPPACKYSCCLIPFCLLFNSKLCLFFEEVRGVLFFYCFDHSALGRFTPSLRPSHQFRRTLAERLHAVLMEQGTETKSSTYCHMSSSIQCLMLSTSVGRSSGHEISLGRFSPSFQRCCGGAQLSNSPTKNDPFLCVAIFVRILELKSESCAVEEHRGAQTAIFELDIRISNPPYIDVCQSLASETGLKSRNVEKRENAV
jgi:hypothetical protein